MSLPFWILLSSLPLPFPFPFLYAVFQTCPSTHAGMRFWFSATTLRQKYAMPFPRLSPALCTSTVGVSFSFFTSWWVSQCPYLDFYKRSFPRSPHSDFRHLFLFFCDFFRHVWREFRAPALFGMTVLALVVPSEVEKSHVRAAFFVDFPLALPLSPSFFFFYEMPFFSPVEHPPFRFPTSFQFC